MWSGGRWEVSVVARKGVVCVGNPPPRASWPGGGHRDSGCIGRR